MSFYPTLAKRLVKIIPKISPTEKEALMAGKTGLETHVFCASIDYQALDALPRPTQNPAFEQLFSTVADTLKGYQDWDVQRSGVIDRAWVQKLAHTGLFGMIIDPKYQGTHLNAYERSRLITLLSATGGPLGILVMVPNSLGPGELLGAYGTEEQKNKWLPKLATGQALPCFGLTSPWAGSDAASIPDVAVVCKDADGKIYAKLNANKRYITLAPIADVIGCAFKLIDPDKLLSPTVQRGFCLALVEKERLGLSTGSAHLPLDAGFANGTLLFKDVRIDLQQDIIGGEAFIGKGWQMLMQCLAEGRALSLPTSAFGAALASSQFIADYAKTRIAFGMPIASMQGPQLRLSEVAKGLVQMFCVRNFALAHIQAFEKPTIVGAWAKRKNTQLAREGICQVMDVAGGKGICMGPQNPLARQWMSSPIAVTVEGANSLTRDLILFNQGIIRGIEPLQKMILSLTDSSIDLPAFKQSFKALSKLAFKAALAPFSFCTKRLDTPYAPMAKASGFLTRLNKYFLLASLMALTQGKQLRANQIQSGRLADALEAQLTLMSVFWQFYKPLTNLAQIHGTPNHASSSPFERYALTDRHLDLLQIIMHEQLTAIKQSLIGFMRQHSTFGRLLARFIQCINVDTLCPPDKALIASSQWLGDQNDWLFAAISQDIKPLLDPANPNAYSQMHQWANTMQAFWPTYQSIDKQMRQQQMDPYLYQLPPQQAAHAIAKALNLNEQTQGQLAAFLEAKNQAAMVDSFAIDSFARPSIDPLDLAPKAQPPHPFA